MAVIITTYNKPDEVLANVERLALVDDIIYQIIIVDQSDIKLKQDQFSNSKVVLIHQSNLGGSGGFARGILSAVHNLNAKYFALLDDDAIIHPQSLRQAYLHIKSHPRTIVGGQMWATNSNTTSGTTSGTLNEQLTVKMGYSNYGELVNQRIWGLEPQTQLGGSVDFTGWWMTLLPREVVETIGLPLPLFLKWDDAEYGLRAKRAKFAIEVLDGVGIWHSDWRNTPQRFGWQSYFWQRNKFIVALLYSKSTPLFAIFVNYLTIVKLLIKQTSYATWKIRQLGLEDLFNPPQNLFHDLSTKQLIVRQILQQNLRGSKLQAFWQTTAIHIQLVSQWKRLAKTYRNSFNSLISEQLWQKTFEANS